jgi:hypothetical protein
LKEEIPPDSTSQLELSKKVKMLSVSRDYNVDGKTLCYTVGYFEFRHLWFSGLKAVDEVEHFLPGVGTRHRHVLENGKVVMMYTSSFVYNPEGKIIFSETDEKKKSSLYFIIEKTGEHNSRLTLELYLQANMIREASFRLVKKNKIEKQLSQSVQRLDKVVREIVVPLDF